MTGSLSMTRRPGRTTLYFVFALVLLTACAGFALQRHLIARSVLEHPVIGAVTALAEEEGWSAVADRIVRPGPVEPLWLAGMIDPPYRRELVFAAPGASAERLGPAVARALFGAEGGPPNEPHDGVYWRTSGVTSTLSLSPAAEVNFERTRGTYLGYPAESTRFRRARRIAVEVAEGYVAVTVDGGTRPSAGASSEPRSLIGRTEPLPWDAPAGATLHERNR